jgi:hypothetical protein
MNMATTYTTAETMETIDITKLLQAHYWHSQLLYDKMFSLEHYMRKLAGQGKTPKKVLEKYLETLDDLRGVNAEMLMLENV